MNLKRRCQLGLSITELMVSIAISVAVLSALSYVYVGSRGAYRTNEALARVQETGRFALEWIARDLRNAGYLGCLSRANALEVYTRSGAGAIPFGAAIWGYEHNDGPQFLNAGQSPPSPPGPTNPTTIPRLRGDVVVLSMLLTGVIARVVEQDAKNANIKVDNNCAGFQRGEDLVATDCQRAAIFNVTTTSPGVCPAGTPLTTITHAASGGQGAAGNSPHLIPSFGSDGRAYIARYAQIGYFIGTNRGGRPALYRYENSGANVRTEEVVENVEDIDFLFGVDTSAVADGSVDQYLTAAQINALDPANPAPQWERVLSVRVSLAAVSSETAATPGGQVIYLRDEPSSGDTVVDAQAASNDRRLRQVFTTTVALRNRLP